MFNKHLPEEAKQELYDQIPKLIETGALNSQKWIDELNKKWKQWVPEMRILCLSEKPDIIHMWVKYGGNHTGVAIEFLPQEHTDSPWLIAEKVTYDNKPMIMATPEEWARAIVGIEKMDFKRIFQRFGCVKTKDWTYQKEWRVFSFKREHEKGAYSNYEFAPSDLNAIYLGYKATGETIDTIKGLLKYGLEHVTTYRAKPPKTNGDIEFEKI